MSVSVVCIIVVMLFYIIIDELRNNQITPIKVCTYEYTEYKSIPKINQKIKLISNQCDHRMT